ncbi:MAG TPA: hypothetical protein VGY77_01380 [Gemmataceae bacterium]|nr:hypothetical protein [Gemmataceae bacterium]
MENSNLSTSTMDPIGLTDTWALSQDIRKSDAGPIFIGSLNHGANALPANANSELDQSLEGDINKPNARPPLNFSTASPETAKKAKAGFPGNSTDMALPRSSDNPRENPGNREFIVAADSGNFHQALIVANSHITGASLVIPADHPRLWWTPKRLDSAVNWYSKNPFTPRIDDTWGNAFVYVVTGNSYYGQIAVNNLMNFYISDQELQGVASDTYRWSDWVPVVYDWTHDLMTDFQQRTFQARYNTYVAIMMDKPWGGIGMEANNYFWGYFRNELNWAIATYYENPLADTFLNHAFLRWDSFLNFALNSGRGGVPVEGSEYGPTMTAYPMVPLESSTLLGRNMFDETNWYKEAIANLIYTTSPAPTYRKYDPNPYYQMFPSGPDEHDGGYPSASYANYNGDFMSTVANLYAGLPIGQYARQWLDMVQPNLSTYVQALDQAGAGPALDFSSLPLDYYAPGPAYLYTRNQWGPQATNIFMQLGQITNTQVTDFDAGTFQIWRNGYYLSKESTGYVTYFQGGDSAQTLSHNGLLFNGMGQVQAWSDGLPTVLRLQSEPDFTYAAVDITSEYRAHRQPTLDNRAAGVAIREFFYVRPLDTMFILDRMQSTNEIMPAEDVTKTFLLHTPLPPVPDGHNSYLATNGDQELRLTSLGQPPSFRVVDEGDFQGHHDEASFYQFRLEASISGSADSYFLNVLQARNAGDPNLASTMTQDANSWTITLADPSRGTARIVLNKGMESTGGSFGFAVKGEPPMSPLTDHVQSIQVTDKGPVWGA